MTLSSALIIFVLAAGLVLFAGSRLDDLADRIARRTKLGRMFAGMILLAAATSLPEVATTVTATLRGHAEMAVHNLLGGVLIQTMILAVADVVAAPRPLTTISPRFALLIQGVGLIALLAITIVVASLEATWPEKGWLRGLILVVPGVFVGVTWLTMRSARAPRWHPADGVEASSQDIAAKEGPEEPPEGSRAKIYGGFAVFSALVLGAGWAIVVASETIAEETGLGQSFVGFTLVALATSLPEISTTLAAARRGRTDTACSNIFGSNSFDVSLVALVAALSTGSIFAGVLTQTVFAAGLGIALTTLYVMSMLERFDWTFARLGWESIGVVALGLGGLVGMYALSR
jgi:cation:H+ antiporter